MVSCCDVRQAGPNWAHICFSDSTDYHRALLFNGHITNNGAMIGVIPCNDKVRLGKIYYLIQSLHIQLILFFRQF